MALSISEMTENSDVVGGIFEMDYEACKVYTTDRIKREESDGLEKHSFLLARMRTEAEDEFKKHVLLLRVTGPASHPLEEELLGARYQNMERRILEQQGNIEQRELDPETVKEIQKNAVSAEVLGTFYREKDSLKFGTDIHTVFPSGEYIVYKPKGTILSNIVNFAIDSDQEGIKIGNIRYSSTNLFSRETNSAPVNIHTAKDLVGHKTAIFGMTRTGKSNTLKIISTAIHLDNTSVGQLIFDPTGEYAYPNKQQDIGIADLDLDNVTIYKYGAKEEDDEESLAANLYKHPQLGLSEARSLIKSNERDPNYLKPLTNAEVLTEEEIEELPFGRRTTEGRKLSVYRALLYHVDLEPPSEFEISWKSSKENLEFVDENGREININYGKGSVDGNKEAELELNKEGRTKTSGALYTVGNNQKLLKVTNPDWLVKYWKKIKNNLDETSIDEDGDVHNLLKAITTSQDTGTVEGYLMDLQKFHSPHSDKRPKQKVYTSLQNGELVIIDTTRGDDSITSRLSKTYSEYILNRSKAIFRDDKETPDIQIYLEEAHRYLSEDDYEDGSTFIELAKEGAKYDIGLVYATQEVSMVDDRILSNTFNWIVTHLNSDNEINELTKYYDFAVYKDKIRKVDDVGFARVRTRSGHFTLPVQIAEFSKWAERIGGD